MSIAELMNATLRRTAALRAVRERRVLPLDSTLGFLRHGYDYLPHERERKGVDVLEKRLLLQRTLCISGAEAARVFYDNARFERAGAAPIRLVQTLFGKGGVQSLDGDEHRARKRMIMSLMGRESIEALTELTASEWRLRIPLWERQESVVLFDEVAEILCRGACTWAGVPLSASEAVPRTREINAVIDSAGGVGPRHWRGRLARKQIDSWMAGVIERVRAGELHPHEASAAHVIAWYRQPDGSLLSPHVAGVELFNVVRPTVAVARFVTFAALALHEHPDMRKALEHASEEQLLWFAQEVRRFYPFFPVAAARVKESFVWRGQPFEKGQRVLLDLYGTNHDARTWDQPDRFMPERFREWKENAFDFVPQGGGDQYEGHRCAGESATIELMKVAIALLTREIRYEVPPQDLSVPHSRVPTLPTSRFVIKNVRHA